RPGSSYELHVTSTSGAANSGTVSIALQVEQAVSTTVVLASVSPVEVGQVVTYSATATSSVTGLGAATGTMMFQDDGNTVPNCGARPVRNGRATCSVSYPAKGAHALIALYSGDSDRSASTSVPLIENVSPASRRSTSVG
ncbi:MAG: Ig-like domain-containing protein, partial [Acidimicrobiales bacterium]